MTAPPALPDPIAPREPVAPDVPLELTDPIGETEEAEAELPVRPVRWGILGTANIARRAFLPALQQLGGTASVVGSRDLGRGQEWAAEYGVARAVGSYEEVIAAEDVDVIYLPLPNTLHFQYAEAALRAGKPVLCEKPLTPTAAQTAELIEVSQSTGVPLWEAFVFVFAEQTERLLALCESGMIGPITSLQTQFDFDLGEAPDDIRLSSDLAGGALYDVGCYPIRLARLLLGELSVESAETELAPSGVDRAVRAVLRNASQVPIMLNASIDSPPAKAATVIGETGRIIVLDPFHPKVGALEVTDDANTWTLEATGDGYPFGPAIAHIEAVVRGTELPRHQAADDALGTAEVIDAIRSLVAT